MHLYSLLMQISTTKKLFWRNAARSRYAYGQTLRSVSLSAVIVEDRAASAAPKAHNRDTVKPAHQMDSDADFSNNIIQAKNSNMPVSNNRSGGSSIRGIDSEARLKNSSRSYECQDEVRNATSARKSVEKPLSESTHARSSDKKFDVTESENTSNRKSVLQSDERTVVGSISNRKPEERETSNRNSTNESKKSTFAVAFPVTVFSQWWVTCFSRSSDLFLDITFPLNKIHLWVAAYQRVHQDIVGHYVDGQAIGGLIKKLHILQSVVLRGNFRWNDNNHIYLPAPATDTEEPDMKFPTFQDNVVQEVLLLILEPIFEPRFSARSHGYRPGRDAHTAMKAILKSFTGCTWFINGDVSILHEEVHVTHAIDSVIKVVKDLRVAYLIKSCLLGSNRQSKSENEGITKRQILCNWGSCNRLKNFLCNTVLDEFDKWIEGQMKALSDERYSKNKSSASPLFKTASITVEKSQKLEYVRFGTEFLVAYNGTRKDAEKLRDKICVLLKQRYGMNIKEWPVHHISTGVTFLDHNISQKVVRPIPLRNIRSSRDTLKTCMPEIKLSLKGSRERCLWYFEQIESPKTVMQIEEILSVLQDWYQYADNRKAIIEYCIFKLCSAYTKSAGHEIHTPEFSKNFRETVQMLTKGTIVNQRKTSSSYRCMDKLWVPEHEVHLRSFSWFQNQPLVNQISSGFQKMQKPTPQEDMVQILWQFLRGSYPVKSDYSWENEVQINHVHAPPEAAYMPSIMNINKLEQNSGVA